MVFQVLSLSGGGAFGLYTATVLRALEERIGAPIASRFDLVAGTSVGGIIGLAAAAEIPARKMQETFEARGAQIFSPRPTQKGWFSRKFDLTRSAFSPKYASAPLREVLTDLFGAEALIGSLLHPCIVPTVNLTKGSPQVFKTGHHPTFTRDPLKRIVDVALATSAAPSYFPIAEIGDELFADGGLYANSPDLLALHEAEHFFQIPPSDIRVLSVGTTTAQFSFSHRPGVQFGFLNWAADQRLVRTMLSSQQMSVDFMMRHKLQDRYVRLDRNQSPDQEEDLALDVATADAQRTMRGLAEATVQDAFGKTPLNSLLEHKARTPVFYERGEPRA